MPGKRDTLSAVILKAIRDDERSLYRIALDAGLAYSALARFTNGERPGISIGTASKLCDALGLKLTKDGA